MELDHISYTGPTFEEGASVVATLPQSLVSLLRQINGFVLFSGGLHVRGVCSAPEWHSLDSVMCGQMALHHLYPVLIPSDVPFAQDCVADQFILRNDIVHKLEAETGELYSLEVGLAGFFSAVQENPVEFLAMQPLLQFQSDGGSLQVGQVLHVYPPFCTNEAREGVSLKPVPVHEAIVFLADFAQQITKLPNGAKFQVKVTP